MLEIFSIVGTTVWYPFGKDIQFILYAVIIVCAFSALYRDNPMFAIVENLMVGTVAGWMLVSDMTSLWRLVISQIPTQPWLIVCILGGLCYFAIFGGKRLATFYRTIISMRVGATLGITVASFVTVSVYGARALAARASIDPFTIIAIGFGICCIFYFTFSKFIEKRFSIGRRAGQYAVFAYFAGFCATMFLSRLETACGWIYRLSTWPAIIVPAIGFIVIIADSMIRSSRAKAAPPAPAAPAKE